jgi:hypothetical protein
MSFLFPAFLIGSLAVAIPIVLHLLRREVAPEVEFSAVHLLQASPVERTERRRLRDVLLLAARVLALLLLATAFARPYQPGAAATTTLVIVALDRSFSMGAPGAVDRARELARAAIDDAGGAPVSLLAFDEGVEVIALRGTAAEARRALEQVTPGFGATAYRPVIARAVEIAAGDPCRLVLITDLQKTGWGGEHRIPVPPTLDLDVRDIGGPPSNVAVLQARVQPSAVSVSIANGGPAPYSGRLRLSLDGRDRASAAVSVPAGETTEVRVPLQAPSSGVLAVSVDDRAGFPADNTRIVDLQAPARSQVLIVVGDARTEASHPAEVSGFYVRRALEAGAAGDVGFEPMMLDGPGYAVLEPGAASRSGVVVLLSTRGLDRRGRDRLLSYVRAGGGLIVAAGPEVDRSLLTGILGSEAVDENPGEEGSKVLAVTGLRHPIFRPFGPLTANLGQVSFRRAWRVPAEGWTVAAEFTDGTPALLERTEGQGRFLLFASDLDRRWNDFPLHPAFVPFVLESLHHVAGRPASTREFSIGEAPAGVPRTPGVHSLQDGRRVVLNVDARESGLERVSIREFAGMLDVVAGDPTRAANVRARLTEARQSYWQYGLVLMLLALVAESIVGRASSRMRTNAS